MNRILSCYIETPVMATNQLYSYVSDQVVEPGVRVMVDFNHRQIVGYVEKVEETEETIDQINARLGMTLKPIIRVLDEAPVLNAELHDLGLWMSHMTVSPVISCFQAMLPSGLKPKKSASIAMEKWARLSDMEAELTPKQSEVYRYVAERGEVLYSELNGLCSAGVIKALKDKGVLIVFDKAKESVVRSKADAAQMKELTMAQKEAMDTILNNDKDVVLLHGVTGSGKTEVYLHLAAHVMKQGLQVLLLVPEISLTPQMVQRVESRFGDDVAIYHSGLNATEKYSQYRRVQEGKVRVVVGTRSAVFMPFAKLGMIIIDEEHDTSYKQDSTPQYHCRDVAIKRAQYHGCKVVLGSATPSLESYARALKNVYGLAELKQRINATVPKVELVDMQKVMRSTQDYMISPLMYEKIRQTIDNDKQVVLLLNRRGFAGTLRCKACAEVLLCPHCDIGMTYHANDRMLKCHTCGTMRRLPDVCPKCESKAGFSSGSFGTQRVEQELINHVKGAKVIRMDADTTTGKGAHEKLLEQFEKKEGNILLGTQMIAKGLDYPDVTLVCVLNADAGLARADYRSGELTFDLIMQASGRGGRADHEGEVVLQVFDTESYVVKSVQAQDYEMFFRHEMNYRHIGGYPPYNYLVEIVAADRDMAKVQKTITVLKENLQGDFKVLGPSELLKKQDQEKIRLVLKGKSMEEMIDACEKALAVIQKSRGMARVFVNVNPLGLE